MKFTVTLDRDEDGVWVAECPAIPGCVSQGETRDKALENVKDAIKACLEVRLAGEMPSLQELLNLAGEENLILRTIDGKEFLLAEVDDFEQEIASVRENPELMALLEERSKAKRSHTLDHTREILGLK